MIEKTGNDLVVIADNPQELAAGQDALVANMELKIAEAKSEAEEAADLIAKCEAAGIGANAAKRLRHRAVSRELYLTKMCEALKAGFVMVPNFPGQTVAIRVKRENPKREVVERKRWEPSLHLQPHEVLPAGEGRYVDPRPIEGSFHYNTTEPNGEKVTVYSKWASAFSEEIGFPVDFLKPVVVELTGKAMARKIFDEVVLCGNEQRGDPMVLGRIYDRATKRSTSFLIAWFIDTKEI